MDHVQAFAMVPSSVIPGIPITRQAGNRNTGDPERYNAFNAGR
jgi:hypothetical protein